MRNPEQYQPTEPIEGMWLFLISRRRYIEAAVEHCCWLNLQADDQRERYLKGEYDPDSQHTRTLEVGRYDSLRRQLWASFRQTSLVALVALLLGAWLDTVDISFNFNTLALAFSGTFLVAWAALFELGGPSFASWDGQTLSETVHPRIFRFLFLPGILGLFCSTVI